MRNLRAMDNILEYASLFKHSYQFSLLKVDESLEFTKLKSFKKQLSKLIGALIEMETIADGDTFEDTKGALKAAKKTAKEVRDIQANELSTNRDLEYLAEAIVSDVYMVMARRDREGIELKDWVDNQRIDVLKAMKHIASNFESTREISVFDYRMNEGENLLAFKRRIDAPFVHTYGTDENKDACQKGKDAGVDNIAKKGIYKMTRNTFDISLYILDEFNYYDTGFSFSDESKFSDFLGERIVKQGGYIIFNIPYGMLPRFENKINNHLRVEAIYRTDDEMGNLLFITTLGRPDVNKQRMELKRAYLVPKKVPHYEECSKFTINKGALTLPETFMPLHVDELDILDAFKTVSTSLDYISSVYAPKERAVELSRPLMEYKKEHLAAVAVSEVINGVYDTSVNKELLHEPINYPHIFSSKIVQKYVNHKKMEMIGGKEVEVFATQKQSALVFKVLKPNGEIIELLNTR